jgi:predicted site-specific integrase-resolvase
MGERELTDHRALHDDPAMPSTPDLVGSAEACRLLGDINRSTLTRWVQLGTITPVMRLPNGGAFLFKRADVLALAKQRAGSAA